MQQVTLHGRPRSLAFPPAGVSGRPRSPHQLSLKVDGTLAALALFAFALFFIQGRNSGREALLLTGGGALLLSVGIYRAARAIEPDLIAPRLLILIYIVQIASLFLLVAFGLPTIVEASSFAPDLADRPLGAVLPLLVVPLASLLAVTGAIFTRAAFTRSRGTDAGTLREMVSRSSPVMRIYLASAAILLLLYWPAARPETGALGYVIRGISTTLIGVPFLVGLFATRFPGIRNLWIVAMVINAIIGLAVGSRFVAFLPITLFPIGYILTLRGEKRKLAMVLAGGGALALLAVSGVIEVVRNEIGRGGIEILTWERLSDVIEESRRTLDVSSGERQLAMFYALGRTLPPPNVAIPALSPETVPYRGFEGLESEIRAMAQINALVGRSTIDLMDAGLMASPARAYGFMINEYTSFEFGILADAWSRGGAMVALLFGFLLTLILIGVERTARRFYRRNPAALLIILTVLAKNAFWDAGHMPLLESIRTLVLSLGLIVVLVGAVDLVTSGRRVPPARKPFPLPS